MFSNFSPFKFCKKIPETIPEAISNKQKLKIWFAISVSVLLILTTFFGFFNLTSFPKTALAQSSNNLESTNFSQISQETAFTDINLVEFDQDSSYKFGDRIIAGKFD